MKTIIITTDFSDSALNAARYAAALAKSIGTHKLVLYHSYDSVPIGTDIPTTEVIPPDAQDRSLVELKKAQAELETFLGNDTPIHISVAVNDFPLLRGIELLAEEHGAELVVAGTTGRSNLEQVLMGSNATNLASSLKLPLLIVPKDALFAPIHKMVFACDLKKVSSSTPVSEIDRWLNSFGAQLLVLHVGVEGRHAGSDVIPEQHDMHTLFDRFDPEYHYTESDNISGEIEDFARNHGAGLIVTIPKSYGFFEKLFHRSVSKQLIKKSNIPLLLLKEKQ